MSSIMFKIIVENCREKPTGCDDKIIKSIYQKFENYSKNIGFKSM